MIFFTSTNSGFSLLEMLIGLTLGLLLCFILIPLVSQQSGFYQTANELARLQENNRYVSDYLNQTIRTVGYIGCAQLTTNFPLYNNIPNPLLATNIIQLYKNDDAALPISIQQRAISHSDILAIRKADQHAALVLADFNNAVLTTQAEHFAAKQSVLLSDCLHADSFVISKVIPLNSQQQLIIPNSPLHYHYVSGAQLSKLQHIIFYIGATERKNSVGKPILAFYATDLNNISAPSEITEDVTSLSIMAGAKSASTQNITYSYQFSSQQIPYIQIIKILFTSGSNALMKPYTQHSLYIQLRERES